MARRISLGLAGILAALAVSGEARANPEPMSVYDGRSMAMGGTGVADNDSMAAVVLNPANFDLVKKFTATLDFAAISPTFTAPVAIPPSMTPTITTNGTQITPLILLGAAYRIFDPLVVGLAAYVNEGSGAAYADNYKFAFGEIEIAVPISFRIVQGLSVGVEPRFGYTMLDVALPLPPPLPPLPISGSLNGTAWGVTAGINWRPIDSLKLGFAWRSSMDFTVKGGASIGGMPLPNSSSTNFNIPNTLRLGASWTLLKDLTLTPEVRWAAFAASNKARTITLGFPVPVTVAPTQQDWKNAWTGALGVEYRLGILALRAGTSVGSSATNPNTATPFDVPPGTIVSVGGGVGLQIVDTLSLDLGVFDQWGSYTITNSPNDAPGDYSLNALFVGLSGTLRI